jgi:ketosteroid isomerase-like protein
VVGSPLEVVEQVRAMVAGEGVVFADLFAEDGVLEYPFAGPGQPTVLRGRAAIAAHFGRSDPAAVFDMDEVTAKVHRTDDPEVVVAEIEHAGRSRRRGAPYRFPALAVLRVRNGQIVTYRDRMDPIALARLLGRLPELVEALAGEARDTGTRASGAGAASSSQAW